MPGDDVSAQPNRHNEAPQAARQGGLLRRLSAWWGGDEPGADQIEPHLKRVAAGLPTEGPWRPERVALLQQLFGEGMLTPGGDAVLNRLFRPLELDAEARVVELGAGLGGVAVRLARKTGAVVVAFEDQVALADQAALWLDGCGVDVKLDRRDLQDTGLRRHYADAVVSKEGLTPFRNKRAILRHACNVLKPDGRLVFVDLFVTGDDPDCPEVAVWSALEHRPMYLTSTAGMSDLLFDIGFELPEYVDVTDAYLGSIRTGFRKGAELLAGDTSGDIGLRQMMLEEAEYWNRRLALIESGEVRVLCVSTSIFQGGEFV